MIAAILQAQWRSMRTFRTGTNVAAAVVSWISGLLFYGFWSAAAFGAQAFFRNPENVSLFPLVLSGALLAVLFYWQITPVITASMGASIDLKKLLAYPIPHGQLFFVELLLRLTTCAEMLLVLAGLAIGLLRNPQTSGRAPFARIVAVLILYISMNIMLSAAVRNGLEKLLLRKRMKEVMMFLLIAVAVVPQFLLMKGVRPKDIDLSVFPDAPYLPWSAASHLLLGSSFAIPLLVLTITLVASYLLARWQFETNLRTDSAGTVSSSVKTTEPSARWEPLFRWPARILPDPVAAIMEKELRSLLRTPQFRFILITGAIFGLIMSVLRLMSSHPHSDSFMDKNILSFTSVYALLLLGQVSYFNCFGYDRSAAQAWFSYPVSFLKTLIAKNLAALSFVLIEIVLITFVVSLFRFELTLAKLAENVAVTLTAALYMTAFGNIASVRVPRPLNPEKMSQGGASKAINAIVLVVMPVVLLPIVLAFWARQVFQSEPVFFGLLFFAAVLGAVLYAIGLNSAVMTANVRREKILADLSKGEGPVSA